MLLGYNYSQSYSLREAISSVYVYLVNKGNHTTPLVTHTKANIVRWHIQYSNLIHYNACLNNVTRTSHMTETEQATCSVSMAITTWWCHHNYCQANCSYNYTCVYNVYVKVEYNNIIILFISATIVQRNLHVSWTNQITLMQMSQNIIAGSMQGIN